MFGKTLLSMLLLYGADDSAAVDVDASQAVVNDTLAMINADHKHHKQVVVERCGSDMNGNCVCPDCNCNCRQGKQPAAPQKPLPSAQQPAAVNAKWQWIIDQYGRQVWVYGWQYEGNPTVYYNPQQAQVYQPPQQTYYWTPAYTGYYGGPGTVNCVNGRCYIR